MPGGLGLREWSRWKKILCFGWGYFMPPIVFGHVEFEVSTKFGRGEAIVCSTILSGDGVRCPAMPLFLSSESNCTCTTKSALNQGTFKSEQ